MTGGTMRRWFLFAALMLLLGRLIFVGAVSGEQTTRQSDSKNHSLSTGEDRKKKGNVMKLSPQTLDALATAPNPTIAVVRCENVEVLFAHTQSESMIAHAVIVETALGLDKGKISLRFFTSKELNMETGRLYLIAAYGHGRNELALLERIKVSQESCVETLRAALEDFKLRRKEDNK
jgi:hypothetical protein